MNTCKFAAFALFIAICSCTSVQEASFPIGKEIHPPKPPNSVIEVYRDTLPSRSYKEIAKLNVHLEKTFFIKSVYSEALPRLQTLARKQGADAIIEIIEENSRLNETYIYNVKAVAIAFKE